MKVKMASSLLASRRILVVEDEYVIAVWLRDHLQARGSVVIGPVPSVGKALSLIESNPKIDAGVLDVNLGGVMVYPVADVLQARNIPFVFGSGYDDSEFRGRYPKIISCQKPYLFGQLEGCLLSILAT